MSEIADIVGQYVRVHTRELHALIEEACERSLVDPKQRGVLVSADRTTVTLTHRVEWGTVAYEPFEFGPRA